MGKITVKEKRKQCRISNRLDASESVNRQAMKNISDHFAESLLPLKIEEKKKATTIWCAVQGLVTLERFMQSPITRDAFLGIVENVIGTLRLCEKHAMSDANLEMNLGRMFVETYSKRVFCIYWPLANAQNLSPVPDFFRNLGQCAGLGSGDRAFQQTYEKFFKETQPFSLDRFEEFIRESRGGKERPKGHGEGDADIDRKAASNRSIEYNPYEGAAAVRGTASINENFIRSAGGMGIDSMQQFQNPAQSGGGTTNLYSQASDQPGRGTVNLHSQVSSQPGGGTVNLYSQVSNQSGGGTTNLHAQVSGQPSGGTTNLHAQGFGQPGEGTTNPNMGGQPQNPSEAEVAASRQAEGASPYLVRQRTGERIPVQKNAFRIGAEREHCDYCIGDNTAVSRNHADLIIRNGRFYVRDNRSLNKTYVDMQQVPPEGEAEIFSGTHLRFANEEFVFYLN